MDKQKRPGIMPGRFFMLDPGVTWQTL